MRPMRLALVGGSRFLAFMKFHGGSFAVRLTKVALLKARAMSGRVDSKARVLILKNLAHL